MHANRKANSVQAKPAKTLFQRWVDGDDYTPEPTVGDRVRYRNSSWKYVYGHLKERGSLMVVVALDSGRDATIPKGWLESV
jgi:hypothetical protein